MEDYRMSETKAVKLVDRFEVCDVCGYEGGFHIILERMDPEGVNNVRFRLKCPSCAQVFDLDLFCTTIDSPN
jgi:hypothetical protein